MLSRRRVPPRSVKPYGIALAGLLLALITRVATAIDPDASPDNDQSPQEVVRLQMSALGENAAIGGDGGIAIAFRFASPTNRLQTGPLTKFISIVRAPAYAIMIDHRSVEFGDPRVGGDVALVPIIVNAPDGGRAGFIFRLSKHNANDCRGCWMTDAVSRIPLPENGADAQRI